MIIKIPFYYRNKFLEKRSVEISSFVQCDGFRHPADFKKIESIGARYYAIYKCSLDKRHPRIRKRINELTEVEIAKLKKR